MYMFTFYIVCIVLVCFVNLCNTVSAFCAVYSNRQVISAG